MVWKVEHVVKPNYLTGKVEREYPKPKREKKQKKKLKIKIGKPKTYKEKLLKKPEAKLPSVDPKRFVSTGEGDRKLVRKGEYGFFKRKEVKEKQKWLS